MMRQCPTMTTTSQATQQQIMAMKAHAILAETQRLQVPDKAKVTSDCVSFLKKALANRREDRPDVAGLLSDPYLRQEK